MADLDSFLFDRRSRLSFNLWECEHCMGAVCSFPFFHFHAPMAERSESQRAVFRLALGLCQTANAYARQHKRGEESRAIVGRLERLISVNDCMSDCFIYEKRRGVRHVECFDRSK